MGINDRQRANDRQREMKVLLFDPRGEKGEKLAELLRSRARTSEFAVYTADSFDQASRFFSTEHPDLILIHLQAGRSSSRRLLREVRDKEGKRHTGVIFLAADAERSLDDLSVECLESGADDFVRVGYTADELMARVRAVLRLKAMTDELRSANHQLRVLSLTDDLTGLGNMRAFNQKFSEAMRRCRRGEQAIGVIMLDLDHFKSVNDSSNHLVGSHVLSKVGELIRTGGIFNNGDICARYGGDEFVILCLDFSLETVLKKAEQLRKKIGATEFRKDGMGIRITCSIGAAWVDVNYSGKSEDIIKAADMLMYRSKMAGRNRTTGMIMHSDLDLDLIQGQRLELTNLDGELSAYLWTEPKSA